MVGSGFVEPDEKKVVRFHSIYGDFNKVHARQVVLEVETGPDMDLAEKALLHLDINQCTLNVFGDREICTKIAPRTIDVRITRIRLADPAGKDRAIYTVKSVQEDELPQPAHLIMGPKWVVYLNVDGELIPLFDFGSAWPL